MNAVVWQFEGPVDLEKATARKIRRLRTEDGRSLLCSACSQVITRHNQNIEIAGAHHHACTNPAGIIYEIGCFASAPGCVNSGRYTPQWSWFSGCEWRFANCGQCKTHLGWRYRTAVGAHFFGLILARLRESS